MFPKKVIYKERLDCISNFIALGDINIFHQFQGQIPYFIYLEVVIKLSAAQVIDREMNIILL